jgi:hypothetical protein
MKAATIAMLGALLLLALPGLAAAQSAGDDQYFDPLAGETPANDSPASSNPAPDASSPSSGTPSQPASTPTASPSATSGSAGQTLPATGFSVGLMAAVGALMVLMGATLRRALPARAPVRAGVPEVIGRELLVRRRG